MKNLVRSIFARTTFEGLNYYTVSRLSENLCRHGKSKDMFEALQEEIQICVVNLKATLLSIPVNHDILIRLNQCWITFCNQLAVVRNVFMELDRAYILPNTKFTSIM